MNNVEKGIEIFNDMLDESRDMKSDIDAISKELEDLKTFYENNSERFLEDPILLIIYEYKVNELRDRNEELIQRSDINMESTNLMFSEMSKALVEASGI